VNRERMNDEEFANHLIILRNKKAEHQAHFSERKSEVEGLLNEGKIVNEKLSAIREAIKKKTEKLRKEIIRIEEEEWENANGDNLRKEEEEIWERIRLAQESSHKRFPEFYLRCPHPEFARWGDTGPGDRQECLICGTVFEVSDGGCD